MNKYGDTPVLLCLYLRTVLYALFTRFSRVIGSCGILFLECLGVTTAVF